MKRILCVALLLISISAYAELVNLNPDPDGDPWYAGGLRGLTDKDYEYLNNLPELRVPTNYNQNRARNPEGIDNSTNQYFRPIFSQHGGSCGQASGVAYTFTYEIDFVRDVSAAFEQNQYPTHYTWNFLNGGDGGGSWYFDGWNIIDQNGCPNVPDWGGHFAFGGESRWMSGYQQYYNGMHNRILETYRLNVSTEDGLETLKGWMTDHLDGSSVGGLACFSAGVSGLDMTSLPYGTPHGGMSVITAWDADVNHAMTFVGFDDSVRFDWNQDGMYTNNIDITNDGIIDMRDWEIGGLIVVNSWGEDWGDNGRSYMLYRCLAETLPNGGIWSNTVHMLRAKAEHAPKLTIKATIKHTSREMLRISAGIATDTEATEPEFVLDFPCFNYQGGDLYMQGDNTEAAKILELGLDITPLLSYIEPEEESKFFLIVRESDFYNSNDGEIIDFSIFDCTDTPTEISSGQTEIAITNNSTTYAELTASINFDKVEIATANLPEADLYDPYSYQMAAQGGTEPYEWSLRFEYSEEGITELLPDVSIGQLTPSDNDDGFATVDLDFTFPFYGEDYTTISVTTDGSLFFSNEFTYNRNEESLKVTRAVTPLGADLMIYPDQNDGIWLVQNEESASFRWKTSMYDQPMVDMEFMLKIYPDGNIEFYYADIEPGVAYVCGISNGDGASYTIASVSNSGVIPSGTALKLTAPDFPDGLMLTEEGLLCGTPACDEQTYNLNIRVTDSNGIFSESVLPITVSQLGINAGHSGISKIQTGLLGNYPNPFNPVTSINYQLSSRDNVTIEIYNVKGQLINTILNEEKESGSHSVIWTGKNDSGDSVSSGVYFYRLKTSEKTETKKMLLVK